MSNHQSPGILCQGLQEERQREEADQRMFHQDGELEQAAGNLIVHLTQADLLSRLPSQDQSGKDVGSRRQDLLFLRTLLPRARRRSMPIWKRMSVFS